MKSKTKSILALAGTLLIGMVLGALIAGNFFRARVSELKDLRKGDRFARHVIKAIDPSPEQKDKIHPILLDFGAKMEEMHQRHKEEFRANHEELHEELSKFLSAPQMKKLEKELHRMRGRARRILGPRHPHKRHHLRKRKKSGDRGIN
jgi:biopolymer transport protein ExbB/TolQ